MLDVIDTARYQMALDFAVPFGAGFLDCYIKAGGDNVDTYVASSYAPQVDRARASGFRHVGHYWVPDANPGDSDTVDTAPAQADFFVDNLHDFRLRTDFIVLDNENLDGAWRFGDYQAWEWFSRVQELTDVRGDQMVLYTNLSDARGNSWERVLSLGVVVIVAAPSYPPGEWPDLPTIPRSRVIGHQYGIRAFAGVDTDINVFVDHAFAYDGEEGTMYNPFYGVRSQGSWEDHAGYSLGGTDYSTGYGTVIPAPAAGTLQTSGGSGEYACGWVGSAGRRSILHLDQPIYRHTPPRDTPDEAEGPMVALVLQHQSAFGKVGWHPEGDAIGWTGASANGSDWGGDVHLHWHGLDRYGNRLRTESFLPASGSAGGGATPIEEDDMYSDADRARDVTAAARTDAVYAGVFGARNLTGKATPLSWTNFYGDIQKAEFGLLPIVIAEQQRAAAVEGLVKGLVELVRLGGGDIDLDEVVPQIMEAAREGAAAAGKMSEEDRDAVASLIAGKVIEEVGDGDLSEDRVEAAMRRVFLDAGTDDEVVAS